MRQAASQCRDAQRAARQAIQRGEGEGEGGHRPALTAAVAAQQHVKASAPHVQVDARQHTRGLPGLPLLLADKDTGASAMCWKAQLHSTGMDGNARRL